MHAPMATRTARARAALLLMAATMTVAACSPTPGVPAQGSNQAPSRVKEIVEARCFGCHPVARALNWKAPSSGAAGKLLDRMVGHGANLTAAERSALIAYFVR